MLMMGTFSAERLLAYKLDAIREQHEHRALALFRKFATAPEEVINRRLAELAVEWDIDRALQANAAAFSLFGLVLAATRNSKWALLPAAIAAAMFQHSAQGWSFPRNLMRSFGFRNAREIEEERYALRLLKKERFGREIIPPEIQATH